MNSSKSFFGEGFRVITILKRATQSPSPLERGWGEAMAAKEKKEIINALMNCRSKMLRSRVSQLLKLMNVFGRNVRVQQAVDKFYYIQKQQELETLEERLSESVEKTLSYMNKLEDSYSQVSARWKKDFVTLHRIIDKNINVEQEN